VIRALCLTLRLVEDWRGEHGQEISVYLGDKAPVAGEDDVLPIVKFVFARQDKKQWTWHANALRQALADGKTSDDLTAYFTLTPPTTAAKKWSQTHPKPSANRPAPLAVEITCALAQPNGKAIKIGDGLTVRLVERDGRPILEIPQPRPKAQPRGAPGSRPVNRNR
jgi:hypothetical protein